MEKQKPRGSADELAVAKAAAWAWYQRGSGSEGRPMSEYDLTRTTCRSAKPSRYKLEAIRTAQAAMEAEEAGSRSPSPLISPSHSCDNSDLLDTYEIERISRQLDYYIDASNVKYSRGFLGGDRAHQRVVSLLESDTNTSGLKDKKKSKRAKGFWLRCGSRDDVVEFTRGFRVRRLPEKHVGVVSVANRRPRTTHAQRIGHAVG